MCNKNLNEKLRIIKKQFLCNVPLKNFKWNNIFEDLNYEFQEILANETVNLKLVSNYPIEINYQKAFLKYVIENLEKQGAEVHDELYSAYGRLVALPSRNEYFKHYMFGNEEKMISVKESVNLISDGTTGLRTWQAALVLAEWSLSNAHIFKGKTVLELGSGVGLAGLAIALECTPSCMYLTDCHTSVLKTLSDNVRLNAKQSTKQDYSLDLTDKVKLLGKRCVHHNLGKPNVFVLNLPWEEVNKENCEKLGTIKCVIAADVVYDCDLFEPLIKTLNYLATVSLTEEFIFSCTERNKDTLDKFLDDMRKASFLIQEMEVPQQNHFIWPTDTPVRLFRFITK